MVKFTSAAFLLPLAAISSAAPISSSPSASSDTTYTGKATWFTGSYGACNEKWDGQVESIDALNEHQMGAASWGNPLCNKRVRILNKHNGKSIDARIVDKCSQERVCLGFS